MAKMYAWSVFPTDINEFGQVKKRIMPGDEVSKEKLKISDEEFDELVELGAIREQPYPDVDDMTSPAEHFRSLESKVLQGELDAEDIAELRLTMADSGTVSGEIVNEDTEKASAGKPASK